MSCLCHPKYPQTNGTYLSNKKESWLTVIQSIYFNDILEAQFILIGLVLLKWKAHLTGPTSKPIFKTTARGFMLLPEVREKQEFLSLDTILASLKTLYVIGVWRPIYR